MLRFVDVEGVIKMKKSYIHKSILITLVCLLCLLFVPALAASPSDFAMVVNDTYVNLRSGPSQDTSLLGSYQNGEWLTVKGQSGNWFYVQGPDGKTGYVSMTYTSKGPETYMAVAVVNNPNASSFLNFREQPNYDAKVLDILYNGVPCRIISREGGWVYANVDGTNGYLRSEFLKMLTMPAADSVATVTTPNNSSLNLRQGPGTGYTVTKQFKGGTYVMVLLKGTHWSKVSVDGYVGFMDNGFLTFRIVKPTGGGSGGGGGGTTPPSGSGYAIVNNPGSTQLLNLREEASTTAKVIGRYMNGTRVTVLAQGTEWCQVQVDKTGYIGYMMTRYLRLYNLPNTPTATVSHPMGTFVNLRKSPSMNASVLTRVPHLRSVTIIAPGDEWYKVSYNGTVGYMVEYFLK
jgi:SH3 domain protein